jgi:sulfide:quinone oxidoreductase
MTGPGIARSVALVPPNDHLTSTPARPLRVAIAGGGVAGLEALLALRALAEERVELHLVAPEPTFTYHPLAVAAPFGLGSVRRVPLARFAAARGARLHAAAVTGLDPQGHALHLDRGGPLAYDACVLALGARAVEAVPGALTYRGEQDAGRLADVLGAAAQGRVERLAFVVPPACTWPLPAYELALMTARWLRVRGLRSEVWLVTAEAAPLDVFGAGASRAVAELLERAGVGLRTGSAVEGVEDGRLSMPMEGSVRVDRVVALPRRVARRLPGVPQDERGFVPVDELCRVRGLEDVLAAGDLTGGRLQQGGLAAQQADVAAAVLAARAGAPVRPEPYRPVLRGLLLTGEVPTYLRRPLASAGAELAHEPLWWPPHKIVGRHLAPALAADLDLAAPADREHLAVELPVEEHERVG